MGVQTLFPVPESSPVKGEIYEGVRETVEAVKENRALWRRMAGICNLALRMALEIDNEDPYEKAYGRAKIYKELREALALINEALVQAGTGSGQLAAVIEVVRGELGDADEGADL